MAAVNESTATTVYDRVLPVDSAMVHKLEHDVHLNPTLFKHRVEDVQLVGTLLPADPTLLRLPAKTLIPFNKSTGFLIRDTHGTVPIHCPDLAKQFHGETVRLVGTVQCVVSPSTQRVQILINANFIDKCDDDCNNRAQVIAKWNARHRAQCLLTQKRLEQSAPENRDPKMNGSSSTIPAGLSAVARSILEQMNLHANSPKHADGITAADLVLWLQLEHERIEETLKALEDEGRIYSTIDAMHYKPT